MMDKGQKYLSDILQAIELIEDFTQSISNYAVNKFDLLFPDSSLANAKKIVGFRNRLIHAYDAVDSSMVWAIVKRHIIPLKQEVKGKLI